MTRADWTADAACKGTMAIMFPSTGGETKSAKALCAGCPVREPCLQAAIDNREEYGVWGGLTATERFALPGWNFKHECPTCGETFYTSDRRPQKCSAACRTRARSSSTARYRDRRAAAS